MNTINHDGQEYVLKSEMEAAFKDRIAKLEALLAASSKEKDEMRNMILDLTKHFNYEDILNIINNSL